MHHELDQWLHDHATADNVWFVKRLAASDTLAGESHQAGPYVPRDFLLQVLPELNRPGAVNPDTEFGMMIASHPDSGESRRTVRAVWYNNRNRGGTRNETRLTGWGGEDSPLLDPASTGGLVVMVWDPESRQTRCHIWICRDQAEEDFLEQWTGTVDPGQWRVWSRQRRWLDFNQPQGPGCLAPGEIPADWRTSFPPGQQIIERAVASSPPLPHDPDKRLLVRRDCEFRIFRSVEEAAELPAVQAGFETVGEFVARAQTVLQRRKSRAGRSLELHARQVFLEAGWVENRDFQYQPATEPGKSPDFLFPTARQYDDLDFPAKRLRMLAVKTTCKDRWRQVLNEADRIPVKHLLTLQEGISESQFREMQAARLVLVVPRPLQVRYPAAIRPQLVSLARFIEEINRA